MTIWPVLRHKLLKTQRMPTYFKTTQKQRPQQPPCLMRPSPSPSPHHSHSTLPDPPIYKGSKRSLLLLLDPHTCFSFDLKHFLHHSNQLILYSSLIFILQVSNSYVTFSNSSPTQAWSQCTAIYILPLYMFTVPQTASFLKAGLPCLCLTLLSLQYRISQSWHYWRFGPATFFFLVEVVLCTPKC